jgi:hypothetical protein
MPRLGPVCLLAICFVGGCTLRSGGALGGYTEFTRIGPRLKPSGPDCPLRTFPSGPPSYSHENLGYARTTCSRYSRNDCFVELQRAACFQGADTICGLNESVAEGNTYLTATFARRLVDSAAAVP